MGWINDLKVMYKIMILSVISIVIMILVGYTGYDYLGIANDNMGTMYKNNLEAVRLLGTDRLILRRMQVKILESVATRKPGRPERLQEEFPGDIKEYEKSWQEYEKIAKNVSATDAQLNTEKQAWQEYKTIYAEILALSVQGKKDDAMALYQEKGYHAMQVLRDSTDSLQKIADTDAHKIYVSNNDNYSAASKSLVIKVTIAFFILLAVSIWISKKLTDPLIKMSEICQKLHGGDFRKDDYRLTRTDEFGQIGNVLIDMRNELNKLFKGIDDRTKKITAASEQLTANSTQSAQAATQVAQAVTEAANSTEKQQESVNNSTESIQKVVSSIDKMRQQSVKVVSKSSEAANQAEIGSKEIDSSVEKIQEARHTVKDSAAIVDKLGDRSQEIGQIVDTISGIAGQTNLLALNAAIEAARAGEHGKGFAVVAEEVRKLSEQSQEAAQQIAELITAIQQDTVKAVKSMKLGRDAVGNGADSVGSLRKMFEQISVLVNEGAQEIKHMEKAIDIVDNDADKIADDVLKISDHGKKVSGEMQSVSAATEQQSASAEEIAGASDSLAKLAQNQQAAISKFKF
ncbi:methyl-accepting chemotaxis protein [Pectinatus sottacetonis]|uniref:methyl-accepting chemotaxis protein n=1 Tax=Pectinatus sottacetonis TaxID=1002795 RepID=UPI0018C77864|nr:methyl-accepting chemotaxis protein [Pectinatus sottacetonis]